jgi:hypothetical protein
MPKLHSSLQLLASAPPASAAEMAAHLAYFGEAPLDYRQLMNEATEIELHHISGQYFRIWGPIGCVEMDEGYGIRERIPGAIPIGDDGGGQVIFYHAGNRGLGLYHVGYGNLCSNDAIWIAPSINDLLTSGVGIASF